MRTVESRSACEAMYTSCSIHRTRWVDRIVLSRDGSTCIAAQYGVVDLIAGTPERRRHPKNGILGYRVFRIFVLEERQIVYCLPGQYGHAIITLAWVLITW